MDPRFRRVAVFAGVAALATGAGIGVAAQGGETASSQAASQLRAGAQGGSMDLSALADELGVTTDELEAAMDAARSSAGPPQAGGDDSLAAALAEELGLSVDKVSAALESLRPQGPAGGMHPPDGAPPAGAAPPDDAAPEDGTMPDGAAPPDDGTVPPASDGTTPPDGSSDDATTPATLS